MALSPAKKGLIAQASQVFPSPLIIPILPYNAKGFEGQQPGKAPGFWTGESWRPLQKWQLGCGEAVKALSDEKNCNVGLLMGLPQQGVQFIAFDLDLETDDSDPEALKTRVAKEIVVRAIHSLQTQLQVPLWVRDTKPGRAAILFQIAEGQSPGTKRVYMLEHPEFGHVGKFETLSAGQQICIAGIHPITRKPITWYRTDLPDIKVPLPTSDEDIYCFPDRNAYDSAIGIALAHLERARVTATSARHKAASDRTDSIVSPEEQAPPSALKLIQLLERLPHTGDVDRDAYIGTLHAIQGCLRALEKLKRITAEEKAAIRHAAIGWAARWEDPYGEGTTYEAEESKWDKDISRTPHVVAGWQSLLNFGISLGLEDLRLEEAREAFAAFELDEAEEATVPEFKPVISAYIPTYAPLAEDEFVPNAENCYLSPDIQSDPYRPRKADPGTFDVKESDIQIADFLAKVIKGKAIYNENVRKWLVWQGERFAWGQPYGERVIRTWIEMGLKQYVALQFPLMDDSKKAKFLSGSRIDTLERMLRVRLGEQDPSGNNKFIIQSPIGAFDLRTGTKLTIDEQKNLRELRCTKAIPREGPTPLFDNVLSTLCSHDSEVIEWVWHFLGYLALGNPINHKLLLINGPGGNGKGLLGRVLQAALGSYAIEASRDLIVKSAKDKHKTSLNDLKGKRYWFVNEIGASEEWFEEQVKSLTGGDEQASNRMHSDMVYWKPEGSFIIATNTLPKFHSITDAILRRFVVLGARIKPQPDPLLEQKIEDSGEIGHVLFKVMRYATKVYKAQFQLPALPNALTAETQRYFKEQDKFWSFWSQEIDSTGLHSGSLPIKDIKQRYEAWIKRQEHLADDEVVFGAVDSLTMPQFVAEVKRQGAIMERTNGDVSVVGVKFRVGSVKAVA